MIGYYERSEEPEALRRFLDSSDGSTISPAALFCWAGYVNRNTHNRDTENGLGRSLMDQALECGLEWREGDLKALSFLSPGESHYARAVGKHGAGDGRCQANGSFVAVYENWKGRKPFMFAWDTKSRKRLYVGLQFWWKGFTVEVTSFAKDETYLNAVAYKRDSHSGEDHCKAKVGKVVWVYELGGRFKVVSRGAKKLVLQKTEEEKTEVSGAAMVERRFKITPEDLRAAERDSKAALNKWMGKALACGKHDKGFKLLQKHVQEIKAVLTPMDLETLKGMKFPTQKQEVGA